MSNQLTWGDLPESTLTGWGIGAVIACDNPECKEALYGNTYSATRGDYWNRDSHAVILCAECGEPMILVRPVTTLEPVEIPANVTV